MFLAPYVQKTLTNVDILDQLRREHESTTPPPSADALEAQQSERIRQELIKNVALVNRANKAVLQMVDDVNARLAAKFVPRPAPEPTPAAATYYAPPSHPSGKAYTNADLKPDTRPARVIVKFTTEQANGIGWEDMRKRGCAVYGFIRADGTPINYANCPFAVAR